MEITPVLSADVGGDVKVFPKWCPFKECQYGCILNSLH